MLGNMIELPKDEDTAEKRVEKIFQYMDIVSGIQNIAFSVAGFRLRWHENRDGKLSKEEFLYGSKRDVWIVKALTLDGSS
ncbi:unnamed protein product [Soboliphyme baturini]|uniref:EF-hand domain-containing protein n=1 Tax=Soboliphyme baturini TaxID=241478 RepID=A0A183J8I4_9BILA|nr:unnamed protein product [Soboliphyme baturini]